MLVVLTRQTFSFSRLQQDGPLSVQVSGLAAFTQVGLRNVLPVDAHAVYMLPGTEESKAQCFNKHYITVLSRFNVQCLKHQRTRIINIKRFVDQRTCFPMCRDRNDSLGPKGS